MSKLPCLSKIYDEINRFEIGIDEAGRGPLFGRLYVAAAVLPKDNTFQHEKMRDSKTIKSQGRHARCRFRLGIRGLGYTIGKISAKRKNLGNRCTG
jgi:ribonuclease HII